MENSETKNCPFCNAEIDAAAKKCKFCGEWVDGNEQFNESQKKWVRLWLVLFIFGTILTLKIFFILAYIGAAEI